MTGMDKRTGRPFGNHGTAVQTVMNNSNEVNLKKERRSLIGTIDRRNVTVNVMRAEVRELMVRLRIVEEQIAEYKPVRRK